MWVGEEWGVVNSACVEPLQIDVLLLLISWVVSQESVCGKGGGSVVYMYI